MATDQGNNDDEIDFDDDDEDETDAGDNSTKGATGDEDKSKKDGPSETVSRAELLRVVRQRDRYKARLREQSQPEDEDDDEDPPARKTSRDSKTKQTDAQTSRATARAARELEKARGELGKMRSRMISSEARTAFIAAGAVIPAGDEGKKALARLTRLLDQDEIEFDGEEVAGIEDQVADIKREMPHLFRSERKRVTRIKGGSGTGDNGSGAGSKTATSADRLAEAYMQGRQG